MNHTYALEPSRADMVAMGEAALDFINRFIEGLPHAPAGGSAHDLERVVKEVLAPPAEGGARFETLLATFGRAAAPGLETAGPGYLAYIPGGGLPVAALAEWLANSVNRYTGFAATAPALVAMEHGVVRWLCREFGLPEGAGGLVTTGGSMATLTAVVAARHQRLGEVIERGTIYVSPYTHHCCAKAGAIAGIPASRVRKVPTTEDLRMDVAAARRMIEADRAEGLRPFLVVGSAGTTDTGAIDPLGELGELARGEDMWFHVDAAYGGFFQLTARGRSRLAGIEAADSITLDPHKGLFLPYGTGMLLVRDPSALHAAYSGSGYVLQDIDGGAALPDYAELGPELTREFRGLRLWLPLHLHGVSAFRMALDEKLDLSEYVHRELKREPRLELPWTPQLSVVAFRGHGGDEGNRRLAEAINGSKRIFISSTRIRGEYFLRLCVLAFRTHFDRIEEAIAIVRRAASI
ncbi:pyridoxal phosphate-dependent decarboxylase family protein [Pendulispora albinea]|uniref:Aminotransferase class V-fold PLP-dependent enzyme n=1 Tax=Pendulispora albinea TaxID=2741071 RepID=A0ABZ2LRK4_9BACT